MSLEDRTAAKLKGDNCLIKFLDGEEAYAYVGDLDDDDFESEWLCNVERFLNDDDFKICEIAGIAIRKDQVKYIRRL